MGAEVAVVDARSEGWGSRAPPRLPLRLSHLQLQSHRCLERIGGGALEAPTEGTATASSQSWALVSRSSTPAPTVGTAATSSQSWALGLRSSTPRSDARSASRCASGSPPPPYCLRTSTDKIATLFRVERIGIGSTEDAFALYRKII